MVLSVLKIKETL